MTVTIVVVGTTFFPVLVIVRMVWTIFQFAAILWAPAMPAMPRWRPRGMTVSCHSWWCLMIVVHLVECWGLLFRSVERNEDGSTSFEIQTFGAIRRRSTACPVPKFRVSCKKLPEIRDADNWSAKCSTVAPRTGCSFHRVLSQSGCRFLELHAKYGQTVRCTYRPCHFTGYSSLSVASSSWFDQFVQNNQHFCTCSTSFSPCCHRKRRQRRQGIIPWRKNMRPSMNMRRNMCQKVWFYRSTVFQEVFSTDGWRLRPQSTPAIIRKRSRSLWKAIHFWPSYYVNTSTSFQNIDWLHRLYSSRLAWLLWLLIRELSPVYTKGATTHPVSFFASTPYCTRSMAPLYYFLARVSWFLFSGVTCFFVTRSTSTYAAHSVVFVIQDLFPMRYTVPQVLNYFLTLCTIRPHI